MFLPNTWVNPLKDKKAKKVSHGFIELIRECKRKPNISRKGIL